MPPALLMGDWGKVDTFLNFQHIYGSFCAFRVINGSKFAEFHWLSICTNHLLLTIDHNCLQAKISCSLGCPLCAVWSAHDHFALINYQEIFGIFI